MKLTCDLRVTSKSKGDFNAMAPKFVFNVLITCLEYRIKGDREKGVSFSKFFTKRRTARLFQLLTVSRHGSSALRR